MNTPFKNPARLRGILFALLPLGIPLLALGAPPIEATSAAHGSHGPASGVLIEEVRAATERYKDINAALADGFVQGTPCVSGPDFGAMGVHFVRPDRINKGTLAADQPSALIYEPMASGAQRLVGVEFIVIAAPWDSAHPGITPALEGNLLNLVSAPNRFGLPAFYELHVWAWEHNPNGSFADWNTRVICDHQPDG